MGKATRIEIVLDGAAAAWLALCLGAALMLAETAVGIANALPIASACAAAAAWAAYRGLAAMRGPQHQLPAFDLLSIEMIEADVPEETLDELLLTPAMTVLPSELLLTRGQMLEPSPQPSGPLLLDDVLAQLRPDSRVVQLFDPARMPSAGELKSRIDRHLSEAGRGASGDRPPDASQALYDALADLRRSLA